ncbi:hypothetical protein Tco_0164228 [Tanacetum coccineum]
MRDLLCLPSMITASSPSQKLKRLISLRSYGYYSKAQELDHGNLVLFSTTGINLHPSLIPLYCMDRETLEKDRQGDPLISFPFSWLLEGLHIAFEDSSGDDSSGLKINIHKYNIYGIGVNNDEVLSMASNAGCIAGDIPFNYLGLPIGSNMKSIASERRLLDHGVIFSYIPAISCPSCNANVESANHIFFECDIAIDMWKLVFRWCDTPLFQASSWDSFNDLIISWHASKDKKHRFYVITTSVLWWLWRYRNSVTFKSQPLRKSDLFDNVRFSSFSWLHNRDHMKLSWNDWLMYPLSIAHNGNG